MKEKIFMMGLMISFGAMVAQWQHNTYAGMSAFFAALILSKTL